MVRSWVEVSRISGMGGVNGIVKYTVVDSPGVPPLTPVSLLKQVGAVIDLNSNTMDLKKIETTTTLRTLPSGVCPWWLESSNTGTDWSVSSEDRRVPSRDSAWRDQIEVKQTMCWILKWFCVHCPQSVISHFISSSTWSRPAYWWCHVLWPTLRWSFGSKSTWFRVFICFWFWRECQFNDGKTVHWSQKFGGEDLLCGAWFMSRERHGRLCWTRGNKLPQESFRQSALICRNFWFIAPISGPQWMCATENVEDAAPSWIMSTQLHRSLTKKQKPGWKERRKKLLQSVKEPYR